MWLSGYDQKVASSASRVVVAFVVVIICATFKCNSVIAVMVVVIVMAAFAFLFLFFFCSCQCKFYCISIWQPK